MIINSSSVVSIPLALTLMTAVMPYDKLAVAVSATSLGSQQEVLELLAAIKYAFIAFAVMNAFGVVVSFLRRSETGVRNQEKVPHARGGYGTRRRVSRDI